MNPQQSRFAADAKRAPLGNLLFALLPDAKTAADLAGFAQQLRQQHGLKGKVISSERLHVTLQYLGAYAELTDELLASARQAAAAVTVLPFEISFDRAHSFPVRRFEKPLVLGMSQPNAGLTMLHQQLLQTLKAVGMEREVKTPFTPHVTLLYDRAVIADQPVPAFSWTVREFVLLYSKPQKGHEKLGVWRL